MVRGSLTGLRAAKYRRISDDAEGLELGVTRQDEDLDKLIEDEGMTCVGDYVDNDLGASTRSKKPRPEFIRLLEDAHAKKFDVICSYTSSLAFTGCHMYENGDALAWGGNRNYTPPLFGTAWCFGQTIIFNSAAIDQHNLALIWANITRPAMRPAIHWDSATNPPDNGPRA